MSTVIQIEGMGCDRCVQSVTSALGEIAGVEVVKVEIGSAEIICDEATLATAKSAIEDCGFDIVA